MICAACRQGGICNAMANKTLSDEVARNSLDVAAEFHRACDKRCDCQHRVGDFTNRRSDG